MLCAVEGMGYKWYGMEREGHRTEKMGMEMLYMIVIRGTGGA